MASIGNDQVTRISSGIILPLHTRLFLFILFVSYLPKISTSIFYPQFGQASSTNSIALNLTSCHIHSKQPFTGSCWCSPLNDIKCSDVDHVPPLYSTNHNMTYGGLYLANQGISVISYGAFEGLKVQKIVLNLNNISDRISNQAFIGLENVLRELYMGGCNIKTMPSHMLDGMKSLNRLHLWANKISVIPPGYFSGCSDLKELILWGNRLTVIKDEIFSGLWSLQKLDLDRNRISEIQKQAFRHLGRLEVIHLGENQIETLLPDAFVHLTNLKVLNLDGNRLKFIYPKAFKILHNLISLSLNDNKLNILPGEAFTHMRNLTAIFLHRNSLEDLWTNTFQNQKSLYLLNLSYNQIKVIPDGTLKENPHLKIFYIDNNLIETVQMCVFSWKRKRPFRVISLLGNPLTCDCKLSWMAELQKNTSVSISGVCEINSEKGNPNFKDFTRSFQENTVSNRLTFKHSITDFKLYQSCQPVMSKCV